MTEVDEFQELMDRVRAGCDEAARELFDRYSNHIARIVRRNLHQRLRAQYDSLDFLQAVWASFFAVPGERRRFRDADDLMAYLTSMAYHKVADAARRRFSRKQDGDREQPLQAVPDDGPDAPLLRHPTPSQVAMAEERWERLLRELPPAKRRALQMLRDGHTHHEIQAELGIHPKVLQRFLQQVFSRSGQS